MNSPIKVLVIANIPSPYRITLFNKISTNNSIDLLVMYCAKTESNRNWDLQNFQHKHIFLKESALTKSLKIKYLNKNVWGSIKKHKPDVIVTGGFFPTMLIAIAYARFKKIKHIINTDAWVINERNYKWYHILLRRIIYRSTDAFMPVSKKGAENIVNNYGIDQNKVFVVPYAVDANLYKPNHAIEKVYDLIFVAQFIDRKLPYFVLDIMKALSQFIKGIRIVLIGDGPLRMDILRKMEEHSINYHYAGYLQPSEIIEYYNKSKILLFPTKQDGWGVVANEALSVGVPCITNNFAGCADELVINSSTGYVLELNVTTWTKKILKILNDYGLQQSLEKNCLIHAEKFSPNVAAQRFESAINYCLRNDKAEK